MLNFRRSAVLCEGCRSAESSIYCRNDSAYLCIDCDSRIHNEAMHHERDWLCVSCLHALAAYLCKADSASLCVACDSRIHSANALASRHHRDPVQPIKGSVPRTMSQTFTGSNIIENSDGRVVENDIEDDDEEEAASWLLLNPLNSKANENNGLNYSKFLDMADFTPSHNMDHFHEERSNQQQDYSVPQSQFFQLGLEFEDSKPVDFFSTSFYQTEQSVMVPDTTTQVSFSSMKQFNESSETFPSCAMDREARVLRYREKKKNRRFEKTIRYASRKAYAEVRPRIKGRFAKQTDRQAQVTQFYCNTMMSSE